MDQRDASLALSLRETLAAVRFLPRHRAAAHFIAGGEADDRQDANPDRPRHRKAQLEIRPRLGPAPLVEWRRSGPDGLLQSPFLDFPRGRELFQLGGAHL